MSAPPLGEPGPARVKRLDKTLWLVYLMNVGMTLREAAKQLGITGYEAGIRWSKYRARH